MLNPVMQPASIIPHNDLDDAEMPAAVLIGTNEACQAVPSKFQGGGEEAEPNDFGELKVRRDE